MINLVSDDVAKVEGGRLNPEEVALFKRMLATIAARSSRRPFFPPRPPRDARRAARSDDREVTLDALRDGKGKLTNPQFQAFVDDLIAARWLDQTEEVVTYGPRSYLELADVIRSHGVEVPQMIAY